MALFDFLTKKKSSQRQSDDTENEDLNTQKYKISGTGRNYDSLDNYDIALKLWLPEAIDIALQEMCDFTNTTKSDLIRQTFFTYLYGRYDLMRSIEHGDQRFALSSAVLYSVTSIDKDNRDTVTHNRTLELGKNTEDVKVWIATQMKQDLQALADNAGISLSHFIRELLVSNLLGHTYLSERISLEEFKMEVEGKTA